MGNIDSFFLGGILVMLFSVIQIFRSFRALWDFSLGFVNILLCF